MLRRFLFRSSTARLGPPPPLRLQPTSIQTRANTTTANPSPTPPLASVAETETITLPDGRHLAYSLYGAPRGRPILFFHGSPSCRLEGLEWHAAALAMDAKLVAVDKWGMGLSSPRPSGRLLDWASDMQVLANKLELSNSGYYVLGASGGGPYALACARALGDGLLGTGVVGGVAPPAAGYTGASWDRKLAFHLNRHLPSYILEKMLDVAIGTPARTCSDEKWKKHGEKLIATLSHGERTYYEEHKREKDELVECYREAFQQGSKGAVQDAKLCLMDWGFRLGDVKGKVRIWNGTADVNVPVGSARYMKDRLPDASLKEYEDDTHFSVPLKHAEEVLRELMGMGR